MPEHPTEPSSKRPLSVEEYERSMQDYQARQAAWEREMAAWNKMYGGANSALPTPPPLTGQPPVTQGAPTQKPGLLGKLQGKSKASPAMEAPPVAGQQGQQWVPGMQTQSGAPARVPPSIQYQQGSPDTPSSSGQPEYTFPNPSGQEPQQEYNNQSGFPNQQNPFDVQPPRKPPKKHWWSDIPVLSSILSLPRKTLLPMVFLVIIGILLLGTLLTPEPPPQSSKPKTTSSSSKPASSSKPSSSSKDEEQPDASSVPEEPPPPAVASENKDKASIDRVLKPGMTESLGNLMELYNEVVFPSALSVPEPEPVVDKTTVNLGGSYVFRPNKNWSSRIDGNSITLVHDDGIVAKFIFNKNKNPLKPDEMKTKVFPPFLEGFGVKTATYNEIFYNTQLAGVSTTVTSKFNDQPLVIETGMMNCNREILTYVISYYETSDLYSEEIIESLLNTITYKSASVTFAK